MNVGKVALSVSKQRQPPACMLQKLKAGWEPTMQFVCSYDCICCCLCVVYIIMCVHDIWEISVKCQVCTYHGI